MHSFLLALTLTAGLDEVRQYTPIRGPALSAKIDQMIAAATPNYAQIAAPLASDAEFLRRVTLDLTGTLPTSAEARAFFADPRTDKRVHWVDRLLASPQAARYLALTFDVLLMDRRPARHVSQADWLKFLYDSFRKNKPWDGFVREILSSDGANPATRAAAKFFLDRDFEPNLVTRDLSRLFLGKNLQCAQCHDHPAIDDFKQEHYYGLLAFLNRTFIYPKVGDPNAVLAEKGEGDVTFVNVFDKAKTQKRTGPRILELAAVPEPKFEKGKEYKVAPANNVKPIPLYSRRAQLAQRLTAPENTAFARSAVNRLWAMMFGRGLIHPVEMDHSDNPPSHPELLELLTREFVNNRYNVKWLLREIALSQTYQRSSEPRPNTTPTPEQFAVAAIKPLSPEQLAFALLQATGFTDAIRAGLGPTHTEPALYAQLAPQMAAVIAVFSGKVGEPEQPFSATLDQTLFLKHSSAVRAWIAPRAGNVVDRAAKLAADPNAMVDELYLSIFTRFPDADERKELLELWNRSGPDRTGLLSEIVWAMITSTEFRFNH